jgi:hypothetical protein
MFDSRLFFETLFWGVAVALYLYGAYWAFAIGRVLTSSHLYRRQAYWLGAVGTYFALIWVATPYTDPFIRPSNALGFYAAIAFFLGFILIFVRIDVGVRVARRSDPLARDTLHWSKVRLAIWTAITIDVVVLAIFFVRSPLGGEPITGLENLGFLGSILAILVVGAPAAIIGGLRARDVALRKSLGWFGLFSGCVLTFSEAGYILFVLGVVNGFGSLGGLFLVTTAFQAFLPLVAGYALYRSATSLVPMRGLPPPDVKSG